MFASLLFTIFACNDYSLVEKPEDTDADATDTDLTPTPPGPPTPPVPANAPSATCSVAPNPVTPPFEAATFTGTGTDPGGLALTYDWQLTEKPVGSAATMPGGGATRSGFVPDLAGTYVGQLIVTNTAGVASAPCEAELEAIPAQDLWVEMYWDQAGDDMDLHLLAPGGAPRTNLDCYFVNCDGGAVLDWGTPNFDPDNPRLDLDDVPGVGPENINIDAPAGGGGYTVMVHDYPGGITDPQSTSVTVNIYLNGVLEWSDTRTITGEDTDTYFAVIDWQSGTVSPL